MSVDLREVLESSVNHPIFGVAAAEALRIIDWPTIRSQFISKQITSSIEAAKTWEARLNSGGISSEIYHGVQETIISLYEIKSDVRLGMVEAVLGAVGMYFAEGQDAPVGVITLRYPPAGASYPEHLEIEGQTI